MATELTVGDRLMSIKLLSDVLLSQLDVDRTFLLPDGANLPLKDRIQDFSNLPMLIIHCRIGPIVKALKN